MGVLSSCVGGKQDNQDEQGVQVEQDTQSDQSIQGDQGSQGEKGEEDKKPIFKVENGDIYEAKAMACDNNHNLQK